MTEYLPIQVVDDEDRPIGEASYDELHQKGLRHRVVLIFVEDSRGRLLLQKRGPNVGTHPGFWDYSAAGHVDAGESYVKAAKRELLEEVGVADAELQEIDHMQRDFKYEWRKISQYVKVYKVVVPSDTSLVSPPDEVADLRWFTVDELKDLLARSVKVTPLLVASLKKYYL